MERKVNVWGKDHERKWDAMEILLQMMPALSQDDVIEHDREASLEK